MIVDASALATARSSAGYSTAAEGAAASHVGVAYNAAREAETDPNASLLVIRRWARTYGVTVASLRTDPN
jgi:uncharacterized protein YmfQ (DUF2313 family)